MYVKSWRHFVQQFFPYKFPTLFTCLLGDGDGFTLSVFRDCGDGDVIINTGLQAMHGVKPCRGLHKFNKDWDTVPCSQHRDAVARNCGGVKRTPAEANSGVSDVDEVKISYFGHIWGGEKVPEAQHRQRHNTEWWR